VHQGPVDLTRQYPREPIPTVAAIRRERSQKQQDENSRESKPHGRTFNRDAGLGNHSAGDAADTRYPLAQPWLDSIRVGIVTRG